MKPLARGDAAVRDAVQVDVVVGRVRRAAGQLRRDEAEELVLELVRCRHAQRGAGRAGTSRRRTRASGGAPVFQYSPCSTYVSSVTMPASRTAKSAAVDVLNFCARNSAKSPVNPGSPGQLGQLAIARLTDVWKSRTRERFAVSSSTRTSMPAVSPADGPSAICTLTSAHCPLARMPTESAALFVLREEHLVVVRPVVVRRVEDPCVQAVLVGAEVEHPHPHLARGAECLRQRPGPAGRGDRCGAGERRLPRVPGGMVELQPERRDERRAVEQRLARRPDEVRRHAAAREEGPGSRSSAR